ncbi:hypothetical protein ACIBPB_14560 [Micromonospora sp. NPDC049836]|uniref:hypothetical protein n=1 Tax=unclassified Micromonospora TaxID=2617518 RepID=UPI003406A28F
MTTVLVTLAVVAVLVAAVVGVVLRRDRGRSAPDEDRSAAHDAEARRQRYEAQRHAAQSHTVRRDMPNSM